MSNVTKQGKVTHPFQEARLVGDSDLYWVETNVTKCAWRCEDCRLVWPTRHQAVECESRKHVAHYQQRYARGPVINGRPQFETFYPRDAIRRDPAEVKAS